MRKSLLLVFIHGFKGNDSTFAKFPSHIAALLSNALPRLSINTAVYPQYETRGDLQACVTRFREWLTDRVIDVEVELGTASPMVEPGVRVILVGHSMGGIVAAETLRAIANEKEIGQPESKTALLFPYVQGLLAFDTPYLGLSPGVVAYGAEGHWNTGKTLYDTATGLFAAGAAGKATQKTEPVMNSSQKALPPADAKAVDSSANATAAAAPGWQRWGKIAAIAGAAGAVAAGGAAAYLKRDQITEGWSWVGSHLEFVGCLARGEELKQRLADVVEITQARELGFANLYTLLGAGGKTGAERVSSTLGPERTFCIIPKSELKGYFHSTLNDKATDEASAHMWMFVPQKNPGFYIMGEQAKELIASWVSQDWYSGSDAEPCGALLE